MSAFAFISERDDRQTRYEEDVAHAAHKLARYAHDKYVADEFARLAWCWVNAGRDATADKDQEAIRDAAITEVLSTASRATKRLWQGFMDTGLTGTDSVAAILQWRHTRVQKAVA